MMITIRTEWAKKKLSGYHVQDYYVNDVWCGSKIRKVIAAIRANRKVPAAVIHKACLAAKAEECAMKIFTSTMTGWRVVRAY